MFRSFRISSMMPEMMNVLNWLVILVGCNLALEFNNWQCGIEEKTRRTAFDTLEEDCPDLMNPLNHCCLVHDECYGAQAGREHCDDTFCKCTAVVMNTSTSIYCHAYVQAACWSLHLLGESVYQESATAIGLSNKNLSHTVPLEEILMDHGNVDEEDGMRGRCGLNRTIDAIAFRTLRGSCEDFEENMDLCCNSHSTCLLEKQAFCGTTFCQCIRNHVVNASTHCMKHMTAFCSTVMPPTILDLPAHLDEIDLVADIPAILPNASVNLVTSNAAISGTRSAACFDPWYIAICVSIIFLILLVAGIAGLIYCRQRKNGYYHVRGP